MCLAIHIAVHGIGIVGCISISTVIGNNTQVLYGRNGALQIKNIPCSLIVIISAIAANAARYIQVHLPAIRKQRSVYPIGFVVVTIATAAYYNNGQGKKQPVLFFHIECFVRMIHSLVFMEYGLFYEFDLAYLHNRVPNVTSVLNWRSIDG